MFDSENSVSRKKVIKKDYYLENGGFSLNVKEILLNEKVEKYFRNIQIGQQLFRNNRCRRTFVAPIFALFIDEGCRDSFLEYTETSTDETELKLRKILSNELLIQKNLELMVASIGRCCEMFKVKTFKKDLLTYTKDNYVDDGTNIKIYLNTNGEPTTDEGVIDFTQMYMDTKAKNKNFRR